MKKIVDIKVGYACNNDCIHCAISLNRAQRISQNKSVNRSIQECKKEIIEAKEHNATEIVLTGGEVTVRKDFIDILSFACEQGLRVNIQTNGRAFSDYELAKMVSSFNNIYFSIALHGHNEACHDKITRREGSFIETTSGIRYLLEYKKFVSIKLVMSKFNYMFLKETVDLIDDLGLKHANITFPHGVGNAKTYFHDVVPKYSEIEPFLLEALDYLTEKNIIFETEAIPYCFLGNFEECASEHFIRESEIEIKTLDKGTVDWSKKRLEIKKKGLRCRDCLFDCICEGPWQEYIENFGDTELKPIEITADNMMPVLVKLKKIKEFRSGKFRFESQNKSQIQEKRGK